jgi:hypothetical protein
VAAPPVDQHRAHADVGGALHLYPTTLALQDREFKSPLR